MAENKKTKVKENEKAILTCIGNKKIRFRKIQHENKDCRKQVSLNAIRRRCDQEHTCEISLKDLVKEKGHGANCKPGKIGISSLKYNCHEGIYFHILNFLVNFTVEILY